MEGLLVVQTTNIRDKVISCPHTQLNGPNNRRWPEPGVTVPIHTFKDWVTPLMFKSANNRTLLMLEFEFEV